jgi:glycosyltransferase involved in cell wall biosynthesis
MQNFWPYVVAREIKRILTDNTDNQKFVSLSPQGASRGNILFSYIIDGFFLKPGQPVPNTHTNIWESIAIAKIFLDLGFSVDVISYLNKTFIPQKPYYAILDVRDNLERLACLLGEKCLKIMHLDTKNLLFQNLAEAQRLLDLQNRKGVTLKPRRFQTPNQSLELAHCGISTGDSFTIETFQYAGKPIYSVPIPASVQMPWPQEKNFSACRNHFLWFGSGGMVLKGLDLVLDAFAEMPECHLTICGPVQDEKDFVKLYHKELFETSNIHTVGWVDVHGQEFQEIVNCCAATILASCTEGASVSSINCMHAALIPILSKESGVDTKGFGYVLKSSSIEEIKDCVRRVAQLPNHELIERSRKAWEYANENHTPEKFKVAYRKVIEEIISIYGQ